MKVSIITASYNSDNSIYSCIESVKNQTYKNIEHIFIDGMSNDKTLEIIRNNIDKSKDFLISEKDKGIYDALNKGIDYASGEIIGFLHSDDLFYDNNVIQNIVNEFNFNGVDGVYGDLEYVSKDNINKVVRKWRSSPFKKKYLKYGWMPPHPTLYIKKNIYKRINGFNTSFNISADYFLIIQLFSDNNFQSLYLPSTFIKMRLGGKSNKNIKNLILKSYEDLKIVQHFKISSFFGLDTVIFKVLSKLKQYL